MSTHRVKLAARMLPDAAPQVPMKAKVQSTFASIGFRAGDTAARA
jgi:hypothetical protein